jgi:hypothetical protein
VGAEEEPNWIENAREAVRTYISNSYTLTPDAELDYELRIKWASQTNLVRTVMFYSDFDDVRYRVSYEMTKDGELTYIDPCDVSRGFWGERT